MFFIIYWEGQLEEQTSLPIEFEGSIVEVFVQDFCDGFDGDSPYVVFKLLAISDRFWKLSGWNSHSAGIQWDSFSEIVEVKEVPDFTWGIV